MTLPQVNLPVAPARRWRNPQTAHLLVLDLASDAGSRACLHESCPGTVLSARQRNMMTLLSYLPYNLPHIFVFPDLLSMGKFFRPSYPILSSLISCRHIVHPFQGFLASTATPFPSSISSALPLASATSGCPEPSAFLPSHLTCQEDASWCLQLIAFSHCLSWALISGPNTPLLSIPVPPPEEQPEEL